MTEASTRRALPGLPGLIAGALVILGVFLFMFAHKALLIVAGLGIFGPGILRELGWLGDQDEFQRLIDEYNAGSRNVEELFDALVTFARRLDEVGVRYKVVGGTSIALHGVPVPSSSTGSGSSGSPASAVQQTASCSPFAASTLPTTATQGASVSATRCNASSTKP